MIRATLVDGEIQPDQPIPSDWGDGELLAIESSRRAVAVTEEFQRLTAQWKDETRFLSSTTDIATHSAYQRIIGLGEGAIPLILGELHAEPRQWFWALRAITGIDPVPSNLKGDVDRMAECWLTWGREQGLLNDNVA